MATIRLLIGAETHPQLYLGSLWVPRIGCYLFSFVLWRFGILKVAWHFICELFYPKLRRTHIYSTPRPQLHFHAQHIPDSNQNYIQNSTQRSTSLLRSKRAPTVIAIAIWGNKTSECLKSLECLNT